tara:strand:- start:5340 stop:7655 length:2316 start_codon:yes stop_codon:yes gene_type:complete
MALTDAEIRQQTADLEAEQIRLAGDTAMDVTELEGIVAGLIEEAVDYIDLSEAPDRIQASNYFNGSPFGNEEDGRSQVVSRDVRDTVALMLPQIMRTFFGSQRVVEYQPRYPEDVQNAEQASDYVNQVILGTDNPNAFQTFYSIIKDALVKRVGIAKVDFERREEVEHEEYTGLDDQALQALMSDPDIEGSSIESYPDPDYVQPDTPPPIEGNSPTGEPLPQQQNMEVPLLHDVVIRRLSVEGSVTFEALPPEEFLIDRRAKSVEDATIVAHRRYLTVSELVSMGYDFDTMLDLAGDADEFDTNMEFLSRHPLGNHASSDEGGEANRKVLYIEAYAKVDFGGSGITSLRRFCCAGSHHKLLHHSPVNDMPFVVFNGYPEPHFWRGQSVADLTMDVQLVKSSILRNMLDSLAKSIHPDTWLVEGQVNIDDALSNKVGKIVRTRSAGAIGELNKSFNGREAFPMLDYMDRMKEDRTGMSKASMGLNPEALQSTEKSAVSATMASSQAQIELLCRVFAENGMKPLFKKILKLLHNHQEKARMVRLRNNWIPIDPKVWDIGMDVSVNVALGMGTTQERMQMLAGIAVKQEKIIGEQGSTNPFVNNQQYHHTLSKMTEMSGFKDVQSFWSNPKDFKPPPPEPPEPTADEIFATAQADKVRADIELDKQKFGLDQEKMIRDDDLQRDKLDSDVGMKTQEMENKYKTTIDMTEIKGNMEKDREKIRAEASGMQQQEIEQRAEQLHQQMMEKQQMQQMQLPQEMSPTNLDQVPEEGMPN